MLVCGDIVSAQTWQVLTLKNCIEPLSYASTAYFVAWPQFPFDCFVKIWATCKNFLGKWITAPPWQKIARTPMGQKYREKTTLASKTRFSCHCFGFQSRHFSLLVGYNIQPSNSSSNQNAALIIDNQLINESKQYAMNVPCRMTIDQATESNIISFYNGMMCSLRINVQRGQYCYDMQLMNSERFFAVALIPNKKTNTVWNDTTISH